MPDDLRRDIKGSLSMNIKKDQGQKREIAPLAREASSYKPSLFARLFAKPFGPREEKKAYQKPKQESLDKSASIPKIRIKDETKKSVTPQPTVPKPQMESVQPHVDNSEKKPAPKPIEYKPKKESLLTKIRGFFTKTKKTNPEPEQHDSKDVQFTKGAKSSVTIHVKDMAVHAPDITPKQEPQVQTPPPKIEIPTKPDKVVLRKIHEPEPKPEPESKPKETPRSDITIHVQDPKPKPEPTPTPKPESKPEPKPEPGQKPTPQPDRSSLNLSSIKEMMHHHDDADVKKAQTDADEHEAFGVNLIPTELQSEVAFKKVLERIIFTAIVGLVLVIVAYVGLSIVGAKNQQKIADLEAETVAYEEQIKASSEVLAQLSTFTEQTQQVGEIIYGRERWTEVFAMLEAETLPEVYYKSIAIDKDDRVSLEVVAKSYFDLARQYKIFEQNKRVSDISFNTASMSTELLDEYVTSVKEQLEALQAAGESVTSTQQLLSRDRLSALLTVDTNISFNFSIQSASSTLDRYE